MSNSLGTLMFGADIDLTQLKQKIQSGNQDILNALKMNYDPKSYTDMVSKLKSKLSKETFEIKISTNAQQIQQQLQQTVSKIGSSANAPIINMNGLNGIQKMKSNMANLTETIVLQREKVHKLWNEYKLAEKTFGKGTVQAQAARDSWKSAAESLLTLRTNAGLLGVDMKRVGIANAALKEQMKQNAQAAKQWNSDHMRLNATLAGGIHVSTQLGSALSSLFAVDAARQFLGNVIEIGGQLEKQRISIGAILGDTVKANHLFEQIKGLALKSPFGVVELDQYTKQLSAYGFKYNELFDMTKRLADISAGAGTDIGRLTLALGHVRSATYLTGITLRQFSMNNIPMLKMLADYYTELEGKIVSTAEVQQRISKRQVSYQDVIEQIKRLTDEGGMFYNMQEKISESLAARYKNLKDAMDIMYGEMAEGSVGDFLKGLAGVLLQTTRHWREIANVMGVAATAFMLNKTWIGLTTASMQGNAAATIKNIMATKQLEANNLRAAASYRTLTLEERLKIASAKKLTADDIMLAVATKNLTKDEVLNAIALKKVSAEEAQALVTTGLLTKAEVDAALATNAWSARLSVLSGKLKTAFSGVGFGTWATIGAMVGMEIYSAYSSWVDRIDDKAKEMQDLIKSRVVDLEKQQKTLNAESRPADNKELKARIDDMKQMLANSEAYTKTLDEQLSKTSDLPKQYDILAVSIDKAIEKNRQMLQYQNDIAEMIKYSSGDFWSTSLSENFRWFFNDDITKNMSQTMDAYKDLRKIIDGAWEYKDAIKGVIEEMVNSGKISDEFAERLKNAPFEEQIQLLATSGYWDAIAEKIASTDPKFTQFAERIKEASQGVADKWDEIADDDIPRMLKKEAERRGVSEKELNKWCLENIDDFRMMLDGISDQLDIKEPAIRKRLKMLFYDYVRFGELEKGMADAAKIGASLFSDENLKRLLDEDPLASLKDDAGGGAGNTGGDKKDKQLEAAKTKLQQYKAFLSEYKKYREVYGKEKAISLLEGLFPELKGQGANIVENYAKVIDTLLTKLVPDYNKASEARKKFYDEGRKTITDTALEREKETIDEYVKSVEELTSRLEKQWKNYRDIMKKTGGRKDIAELAFTDGRIWDETSKKLLEEFNAKGNERGVVPIEFRWDMNEKELEKALGKENKDLIALAKKIQEIIRGNYENFLKDTAEAYSKSLTEQQKLNELIRERGELEKAQRQANTEEQRKGYQIQIDAKNRQIAEQQWAAFKETNEWGRIFGNLDKMSTKTLRNMRNKLREVAPTIDDSVESTKALYEAIEKIDKVMTNRNPFEAIQQSLSKASNVRSLLKSLKGSKDTDTIFIDSATARETGIKGGKRTVGEVRQEGEDQLQAAYEDFSNGVQRLASDFGEIQKAIQPVIDLFELLGDESLKNFFEFGSSTLNTASNTASAMNNLEMEEASPYMAMIMAMVNMVVWSLKKQEQALQEEINASKKRVELLQKLSSGLESSLERAISGIYDFENTREGEYARQRFQEKTGKYVEMYDKRQAALQSVEDISSQNFWQKAWNSFTSFFSSGGTYTSTTGGKENDYSFESLEEIGKVLDDFEYVSEELIKALQQAYNTGSYYDMQYASLVAQRDEIKHQIQLEEESKDSDNEKIEDLKNQLEELEDQIYYFAQDMAKQLYDIDFKSWANELAEALVDAWESGEDAAEAYQKKVSEILKNLGVKMIAERFIAKAIQPIMDRFLEQYETDKGVMTEQGLAIIAEMYEKGEEMAQATNDFMDGINEVAKRYGADLKDTSSSYSTGSSIKGITENTADLLASYLNSIRADVSVNRNMIATYYPQFLTVITQVSVLSQTQVTLQQQIAANTLRNAEAADKIYDILHRVTPDGTSIRVK